jgi:deazaflavin-dependent oxidoreductase (nitroreductase family)
MSDLLSAADEDFCYLTTIGRVSRRPHEIEIWFALDDRTLYMLAGGGMNSDWVKNLQRNPQVSVRIAGAVYTGAARIVADADEDALARRLVVAKYQPRDSDDLTDWGRTALPVAVELAG